MRPPAQPSRRRSAESGVDAQNEAGRLTRLVWESLEPQLDAGLGALLAGGISSADLEASSDALAAAMARLVPKPDPAAAISGPVWTTEQVRAALGGSAGPVSRQAVDARVRRGAVLALPVTDRGERAYPLWQFTRLPEGRWDVVPGLPALLQALGLGQPTPEPVNRWTLASWLRLPHPALGDISPLKYLTEDRDTARLLSVARASAARWAA